MRTWPRHRRNSWIERPLLTTAGATNYMTLEQYINEQWTLANDEVRATLNSSYNHDFIVAHTKREVLGDLLAFIDEHPPDPEDRQDRLGGEE